MHGIVIIERFNNARVYLHKFNGIIERWWKSWAELGLQIGKKKKQQQEKGREERRRKAWERVQERNMQGLQRHWRNGS